jgi:NADH-quinone oxidoreductase subunit H
MKLLPTLLNLFLCAAYGIVLGALYSRIVARSQGRIGIPVYQNFLDLAKNQFKRTAIMHGIMFYLGPVFRLGGGVGLLLFIPLLPGAPGMANLSSSGDLLLAMYFIFFGQLGMALGASESGHPYSSIGIARGLSQMTAFEVPFALAAIAVAIQYGTFDVSAIALAQQGGILHWTALANPFAALAALVAFLGMTGQSPFDNVLAPQEIPIGPPTEFHSGYLAMMQLNRAIFQVAKCVLFIHLFFGGAANLLSLMAKVFVLFGLPMFVDAAFPRMRVDQSIRFFLRVPTALGIAGVLLARWFH